MPNGTPALAGYRFHVTCPRCDAALEHVTGGTSNGTSTRAIARCQPCRDDWIIEVRIAPTHAGTNIGGHGNGPARAPVARCGTDSGYYRHRRLGTPSCPACREAHAAGQSRRNARKVPA